MPPMPTRKLDGNKLGKNLTIEFKGDKAIITMDLSKTVGDSKSGKTTMVASSGGNIEIRPGIKIGVNCYKEKALE